MGLDTDPELEDTEASLVKWVWSEISSSYLNIALTVAIVYLLYKILFQKEEEAVVNIEPPPPPVKKTGHDPSAVEGVRWPDRGVRG